MIDQTFAEFSGKCSEQSPDLIIIRNILKHRFGNTHGLGIIFRYDRPVIITVCPSDDCFGIFAEYRSQHGRILDQRKITDRMYAHLFQDRHCFIADAAHICNRQRPELIFNFADPQYRNAHRFLHVAGHLCQEHIRTYPDGTGQAEFIEYTLLYCYGKIQRVLKLPDGFGHIRVAFIYGRLFDQIGIAPDDIHEIL